MGLRGFEVLEEAKDYFTEEGAKELKLIAAVKKPGRSTTKAAGYDICSIEAHDYMPGEMYPIRTGITSFMQDDEVLQLFVRSGMAFKNQMTLQNATGIVDADYYGKEIKVLLRNEGSEVFTVNVGDRIAQGVFTKYLVVDDEDVTEQVIRKDGLGSTGGNSASQSIYVK